MQDIFKVPVYDALVANNAPSVSRGKHLKTLRETAGLSQRELAEAISETHSNINYWENSGHLPRSNVLIPMAKALGVSVEELLGEPKARRAGAPGGKVRQVFESVARLPRRQQEQIVKVVNALVAQSASANSH